MPPMKKIIILTIYLLLAGVLFAQGYNQNKPFSSFAFGIYAGPNFTSPFQAGYLTQLEIRMNLSNRLNAKLSIGLSSIFEDNGNNFTTYYYFKAGGNDNYQSYSYKLDKYEYSIVPLSVGIEYCFSESISSPYLFAEAGYNLYAVEIYKSNQVLGAFGTFTSKEQLPMQYRLEPPKVENQSSFRFGLGAGTRFEISGNFYFEARYIFNINTQLVNSHQILLGISI